ncbi:MAG TPA: thiamine-phosphate kinase [Cyclobacteriaceae bacterium]|nr:thiamine-phosphate kinase [Cyclobacteriaceae bacterium]
MTENRSEINKIGEFGLIDHITKDFSLQHKSSITGVGDDAAVIDIGEEYLLISTDMLTEGVHFDLSYMPLRHLGYKAVAVNVSDIAAMNGKPEQITVSIGLSNRFSVEAVDELYKGIAAACKNYKIDLIGGDTTSSASGLIISITVLGRAAKDKVAYRSGAKANDIICVTGDLGAAYLGLQVLEREKQVYLANPNAQPDLERYDYIVQRQLKPEARMDIIYELEELNIKPSAMMDISDGLVSELFHICKHSKVGVRIFEDKLPIDKMTFDTGYEFKLDPTTCALNGGEDYELLFTINQNDFEKVKHHADIHFIGYVSADASERLLVTKKENIVPLQAQGWDHFKAH